MPEVLPKTDNSVGIDLGLKTKASCKGVPIFVMQRPYMVKKIDAPEPLKKRMLEVPKTKQVII